MLFKFPNGIREQIRNCFGIVTLALGFAIMARLGFVCAKLSAACFEPSWRVPVFYFVLLAISTGPGLFILSRLRPAPNNLFLSATVIFSTGLGATMLAAWVLYALGLFTRFSGFALVTVCATLGICGLCGIFRRLTVKKVIQHFEMSPWEFACLAISILLCEGLFEAVAGSYFEKWDAMVSWDKWAADIAARRALGGYVAGAYPPGIPLLVGLAYKVCLPAGTDYVLTPECLLAPGFFQIFPLLTCLAVLSAARSLRTSAVWTLGLLLGNSVFLFCLIKHIGYVDVPLGAFAAAATALLLEYGESRENSRAIFAALLFALFPVSFTKANGFGLLIVGTFVFAFFRRKLSAATFAAFACTFVLAGIYYLHQWVFGIWTNWAEKNLFNHSLHVFFSHSSLFNPSFAHFLYQVRLACRFYGYHTDFSVWIASTIGVLTLLAAFVNRRTRPAALVLSIATTLWFYTGSYDYRNFVYLIPLFAIMVPTIVGNFPRRAAMVVTALASAACLYSVSAYRTFELARRPLRRYVCQPTITRCPEERRAKQLELELSAANDIAKSDLVRRAPYFMSRGMWYRFLFGKGVFTCARRFYGGNPKALAIAGQNSWLPAPNFIPISDFTRHHRHGPSLCIESPELHEVPFAASTNGDGRTITIDVNVAGIDFGDSGFISVHLSRGDVKCNMKLLNTDAKASGAFVSHQKDDEVRLVFFVPRETNALKLQLDPESALDVSKVFIGF